MSQKIPAATPDSLLRIAAGKTTSTLLELALELELFAKLAGRQVPLPELAEVWQMPGPSARCVAQFLTNAGILVFQNGKVANGPLAEQALTRESQLRQALALPAKYDLSLAELRSQLLDPPALHWYQLRDDGEISDARPLLRQNLDEWVSKLAEERHEMRLDTGRQIAQTYDFSGHRLLLDLGGSSGGVSLGIRQLHPHLECLIFDLPEVAEVARAKIAAAGAEDKVRAVPGSFFTTDFPRGADVVLITNVLHTWAPADNRTILGKAFDAMAPGGTLIVREVFFEDDWAGSIQSVFEAFILIGKEGATGWQPSYGEMEELLRATGFDEVGRRPELVIGKKPAA